MGEVVSREALAMRVKDAHGSGRTVAFANGCFDLLHVGHVRYLEAARSLGDALVVGINGDDSTRKLKGDGRPINNERDRAEVIAALACVDLVTIFPEVRAVRFLEMARPDIYVKGGDYTVDTLDKSERVVLEQIAAEIRIIPFQKGYSTSGVIGKLRESK